MLGAVVLIVGGYLLGALPFSVAVAVAVDLDPNVRDIHVELWCRAGVPLATAAMLVDVLKGVFPVLVGYGFGLPMEVVALAGVAAACGQMWPPMRGHGEKGNSAGVGALLTLLLCYQAYPALLCAVFFAAGAILRLEALSRETAEYRQPNHPLSLALPLGTLLGFVSCPVLCWLSGQPQALVVGSFLLLCVIVARRLTADLSQDLSIGARMSAVLLRRLLFDQTLMERGL
jgi:glycerol-3-phosphate acyltransferase PlsY